VRGPNADGWMWAGAALLTLLAGSAAAEEFDPAKIPWEQIEAWAQEKSDANPFRLGAQPPPNQPAPPPKEPKKPEPEPPKKLEPDAPVRPEYTPRPGVRRPDPLQVQTLRQKALAEMEDDVKEALRRKDMRRAFDNYFRNDQYDNAMQVLMQVAQDPKKYADEHNGPWLYENFWQTGVLTRNRMPQPHLDKAFQDWESRIEKRDKDPNWMNWFNGQKDYFTNSAKYLAQVQELEIKGDTDPESLWQACERLNQNRPPSNMRCVVNLIKLREWFPDYGRVMSGEVQWRMVERIYHGLRVWEIAADEAKAMIERHPKNGNVTGGEAFWRRAESLYNQGNSMPRGVKAYELWEEARRIYQNMPRAFPQHYSVKDPRQQQHGPPKTDVTIRLEDLNNKLRSR